MSMLERIATSTRPRRIAIPASRVRDEDSHRRYGAGIVRLLATGLLGGLVAIALVSCGSSGKGLIPLANAGPLQSDFEAVAQAAQTGGGNCTATVEAINKTEQDFAALPATIDAGLRDRLRQGISNLRERALALCTQPLAQTTTATTSTRTTTTSTPAKTEPTTTPTTTQTTSTQTTPTTPSTPPPASSGGGTVAPGSGANGEGAPGGGTGVGESGGAGIGAGGQESGK